MDKMDNTLRKMLPTRKFDRRNPSAEHGFQTAKRPIRRDTRSSDLKNCARVKPSKVKWEKVIPYTSTNGEVIPINEYFVITRT